MKMAGDMIHYGMIGQNAGQGYLKVKINIRFYLSAGYSDTCGK